MCPDRLVDALARLQVDEVVREVRGSSEVHAVGLLSRPAQSFRYYAW